MRSIRFKSWANFGVGVGIAAMIMGSLVARQNPDWLMVGLVSSLGGWALLIWGCVNYMRWKGYSGWFGLLGYLLLLGLIILVCFPNRRKRMAQPIGSEPLPEMGPLSRADRTPGYPFLLALAPLAVLFVVVFGLLSSARSNVEPGEWQEVAPAGIGFRALMPGTPRLDEKVQETPAGNVEMHKFSVEPKGKKELFMIVAIRFPEEVGEQLGGTDKLLDLGRQDLLAASQGQLQSERRIVRGSHPVLELEILPPKGAIIKARVYARKNQLYQVTVHVPKIRLDSDDVWKFFDSFQLTAEPGDAPERDGQP